MYAIDYTIIIDYTDNQTKAIAPQDPRIIQSTQS